MAMSLNDIAVCVDGQLQGENLDITGVGIDTRALKAGDLYIAIRGEQFDGHDFLAQAEAAGARAVIVAELMQTALPQIIVKDTRLALAELAAAVREKAQVTVCAMTGSNGKTTVKEMIAAILSVQASVLFTAGNFNNEIGVPLTLLRLTEQHQYAVIEMGANHQGEIAYSCQYAKPDVAIINNVGAAHIEGFGSLAGVAQAKAEIIQALSADGVAILNADDVFFSQWQALAGERKLISFGLQNSADVTAENISIQLEGLQFKTEFELIANQQRVLINLGLAGEHNVLNALAASAACLALGIALEQIQQGLQQVKAVQGRLQLCASAAGNKIINDTYNANPASLEVALQVLQKCATQRWVVLGAFGELGDDSMQCHRDMGEQIKQAGVTRLFAVGELAKYSVKSFGKGADYFSTKEELITALQQAITAEVVILVKGSRAQKMETVVNALIGQAGN
ncbi:MAG: UDP-N-acetylmuramoyl-tripeptide--D-alanyl-D-alanine ligase [Methyloprofundus sp.]|nr:UDP-N-acetylmuramoyl-tripeptide--D-alanyl-D-alanine ligase [Methyloprofundus sp.]